MSGETIEINDKILKKLISALRIDKMPVTRVGILGDKNARDGSKTNSEVGARHEFGTSTMPVRSFLREPLNDNLGSVLESKGAFKDDKIREVIQSGTIKPWLSSIAIVAVSVVHEAFNTGGFGKWKQVNMRYKKNKQILVETTQLLDSITWDVK